MIKILSIATSALAMAGLTAQVQAAPAIGLAGGSALFSFDTSAPGATGALVSISGLGAGETLLGLDYRPVSAVLYGLGSSGSLYTLAAATGVASFASKLSVTPASGGTDIAFNPTVDRLRVVSTSGQSLRSNVDTGAVTTDTPLAYATTDANAGKTPGVTAVAYTNQVGGTVAGTTLYDLDAANGVLAVQNPPNAGTLNTVGALGVAGLLGLDIASFSNLAFASSASSLYSVNLTTGAASLIGGFGLTNVTDIALVSIVPEPVTSALLGTGLAGLLAARRRRAAR